MASNLVDLCRFYSTTSGASSTPAVGAHVAGFCTPAEAGAINGLTYSYSIYDPVTPSYQKGTCTYNSAGPTLSILTIATSSNGGAQIVLSGTQIINLTALASDLTPPASAIMANAANFGAL